MTPLRTTYGKLKEEKRTSTPASISSFTTEQLRKESSDATEKINELLLEEATKEIIEKISYLAKYKGRIADELQSREKKKRVGRVA